jgi:hypothetical protein
MSGLSVGDADEEAMIKAGYHGSKILQTTLLFLYVYISFEI